MGRRTLTVIIESDMCALVSGPGSRELLTELKGRPPVYSVASRAWVVTARSARDVVALAEVRGCWDIVVQHAATAAPAGPLRDQEWTPETHPGEHPDPGGMGLW